MGIINIARVVVAILLRETKTRFGKNKLGYLWALIEPMVYVGLLLFIRSEINTTIPFGENLYLFILTGILMYRVFISVAGRATNSISANQALLTYPIVKPVDTILARLILEIITMLVVIAVFFLLLESLSEYRVIQSPHIFLQAVFATMILSGGIGVFNAVFSVLFPAWERLWGLMKFPILILSGVFYIPKSMPPFVQEIISWNPLLHCIEWLRYGSYLTYDPMLSRSYVIFVGLIFLTVGLLMERIFRSVLIR